MNKPDNQQRPERKPAKLNPIAVEWLAVHREALRAAGWSTQELYQRHKFSRSIIFSGIWNKSGLEMTIGKGGKIAFSFVNATGQRIKQTDHPRAVMTIT